MPCNCTARPAADPSNEIQSFPAFALSLCPNLDPNCSQGCRGSLKGDLICPSGTASSRCPSALALRGRPTRKKWFQSSLQNVQSRILWCNHKPWCSLQFINSVHCLAIPLSPIKCGPRFKATASEEGGSRIGRAIALRLVNFFKRFFALADHALVLWKREGARNGLRKFPPLPSALPPS